MNSYRSSGGRITHEDAHPKANPAKKPGGALPPGLAAYMARKTAGKGKQSAAGPTLKKGGPPAKSGTTKPGPMSENYDGASAEALVGGQND
jgi:hypothetical protein